MERNLTRIWSILPERMAELCALWTRHRLGEEGARIHAASPSRRAGLRGEDSANGVALLQLFGMTTQHETMMTAMLGGTSLVAFGRAFDQAAASPQVRTIVIEIDSPGGEVDGIPELWGKIMGARGSGKKIIAVANSLAASAAYWLMSAASEAVVTPSGRVGSIGVMAIHEDISGALENEGVKVTLVSAGKFKVDGNPFEPLSATGRAHLQSEVDRYYGMFITDVARGRNRSRAAVRGGFGEGRMVGAEAAVAEGMADRIDTLDGVFASLGVHRRPMGGDMMARMERTRLAAWESADDEVGRN